MGRNSLTGAAIVLLSGALAAAQQPAQSPPQAPPQQKPAEPSTQQPPTFRTGADLVRVDVAVIDRKGNPVTSLAAEDFEVEEDGVRQEIRTFQFLTIDGQTGEDDDVSLEIRSRSHARQEAARDDVRVFLIFWDEYHIDKMASTLRAREYLTRFVRTAFGPRDLVAFMDPMTPLDDIRFTRDRLELAEHVRRLRGRLGEFFPPRNAAEEAHLEHMRDVTRLRAAVTASALKAAAVHLGALREGRKSIIFLSEGLRGLGRDEHDILVDVTRAANDANTAIYVIDPRGLGASMSSSLQSLGANSGGDFTASNDFDRALNRVVTQSSALYLLGYAPAARPMDGKFHKIKVRVKRPGLDVRARAGYWAPTVDDTTRARTIAAESELPPAILRAFAELPAPAARRTIDLWVGTGVGANGRPELNVSWQPRQQESSDTEHQIARVSLVATSTTGAAFDGDIDPRGTTFEVPAGEIRLLVLARNSAGDVIDREPRTVVVPDITSSPLVLTTPFVLRATTAAERRTLGGSESSPGSPLAGREFARGDRLLIRFAVYGESAGAAAVTARLLSQRGAALVTLPVNSGGGAGRYEIDLALSTVARGDYVLAIEAVHEANRAEAFVPIRLVR